MNKEELKELIRKELEEALFAHPSKHKGGFAHPGSQPHVKDAKKNAKTINVRHKKTKEKLDIPDDPATIKKYKKLGYTLWIGSRGKYESVNERKIEYSDVDLKNLAKYTDRNQHLEARSFIAQSLNHNRLHKAYEALITLRDVLGHTPRGAEQVRSDLDKNLKKVVTTDIKNWEQVWRSL